MGKKHTKAQYRKAQPIIHLDPKKNIYRTNKRPAHRQCRIPVEQRAPESKIDTLRAGWVKFQVNMREVAGLLGMNPNRLYCILRKECFASIKEMELVDKAMVHLILKEKSYNSEQNPQKE